MGETRTTDETTVLVVGGGATGVGIARDLSMRGVETRVVERGNLTSGATGHTHGVLHSGARYAVADPDSAAECIAENRILRDVAAGCVRETGGYFLDLPGDPEEYFERKVDACREAGIDVETVDGDDLREDRPWLTPEIERALRVPDGVVDAYKLTVANAVDAREHGATVTTGAEVVDFHAEDGRLAGATVRTDEGTERIDADHVVNAAGAWAGEVAALAGVEVPMKPSKGVMVVVDFEGVDAVYNRCRPTADGDIVVPRPDSVVLGTTSEEVSDPDDYPTEREEVDRMVAEGSEMIPDLRDAAVREAYWGVRPLFGGTERTFADGRALTRSYTLLDHATRDDLAGFSTIVGGKLTTYRLMAESVADAVCDRLGVSGECRTADEPLPGPGDEAFEAALAEFGPRPPAAE
ncbi:MULTISPECIES: FAD-dependent oxidoreductase [Halorussus]|uniref:FAD-dependent oxidoreductase n=1 Tax=Halorussus TaxID=1070314 RepID=UPI00209EC0EE|nr:FAD-dependent oxidoreductase [Halorussus vallis]USZ74024.1 FAD-dependent oxidoreductase [Halorussus vallis]